MKVSEFRDDLPTPLPGLGDPVLRFHQNVEGRDFVVGDIHGMFGHLHALLDDVRFNGTCDRLFSVGDLVDRGPESAAALEWLAHPWFHACRGNHEQFAIDSVDPEQMDLWVNYNGGEWWAELDAGEHDRFRAAFLSMPLAMEVATRSGTVGVVHADVPPFLTWENFISLLEAGNRDAVLYAMWSRNRISGNCSNTPVSGNVERIYCGHTPTRYAVQMENVFFIDTGAAYIHDGYAEARLTMVEIQPEPHREYGIDTARAV